MIVIIQIQIKKIINYYHHKSIIALQIRYFIDKYRLNILKYWTHICVGHGCLTR